MKTYYYDANDFEMKNGKQYGIVFFTEGSLSDLGRKMNDPLFDYGITKINCFYDEFQFNNLLKYLDVDHLEFIEL